MTTESTDSQAFVAVLALEAQAAAGAHPEVELLLDYQSGTLDTEAEADLQAHLVGCRPCVRTLLDLKSFRDTKPESGVVELATIAGWRDFERRIDKPDQPPARGPRWLTAGMAPWARVVAATLLAGVLGLSAWTFQLRQANDGLRQELLALNAPSVEPSSFVVKPVKRGRGSTVQVKLAPGEQLFSLDVRLPVDPYPHYAVLIEDMEGQRILELPKIEPLSSRSLLVPLSRELAPEGKFSLWLWGLDSVRTEDLSEGEELFKKTLEVSYE